MKKRAAGSANREKGTVEALRQEPSAAALERLREERSGPSRYRAAEKRLRAQLGWYRGAELRPYFKGAEFLFLKDTALAAHIMSGCELNRALQGMHAEDFCGSGHGKQ